MPTFAFLFAIAIVITLTTAIWLLLHLTSVTSLFAGNADIVASPSKARAPRGRVILMLALFVAGLVSTIGIQIVAINAVSGSIM